MRKREAQAATTQMGRLGAEDPSIRPGVSRQGDREARCPSGAVPLPAVLGRLTEQLRLQRKDVIEDAIDAPTLEAMIGEHPGVFQVAAQ
jgi:hypothetical protein